jgi:hypothetical protein
LAVLDNGYVFVSLLTLDKTYTAAVGTLNYSPDGRFVYIIDYEYGNKVEFIIMPSDDAGYDEYFIDFPSHGLSGFIPAIQMIY